MGTCQFCKVMYDRRQALTPGIHFFLKIGKFRLPYFHVFASDVCETSLIYLLWLDQVDVWKCFLFICKTQKFVDIA